MGLFHPGRDAGEGKVEWVVLLNLPAVRVAAPGECRSIEKCASPLKGSAHAQLPAKDFCSALIYTILWGQEKWLSWLQGLLATGGKGGLCKNNLFSWLGMEISLPPLQAPVPQPSPSRGCQPPRSCSVLQPGDTPARGSGLEGDTECVTQRMLPAAHRVP